MGKIQKTGRWVPHKLNDRQTEKNKNTRHFAHWVQKEVDFAPYNDGEMKSGFILRISESQA